MTKRKKWGLFLIVAPFALLLLTLSAYAIMAFVVNTLASGAAVDVGTGLLQEKSGSMVAAQIVNIILSLLGLIGGIGILVGVPIGIYLLASKELEAEKLQPQTPDNPKYQNITPEQLKYINSWSLGGFIGSLIWIY